MIGTANVIINLLKKNANKGDKMSQENKESKQEDKFAGFKRYYVGGQEVIDLTSIDEEYEPVKFNFMDIERQAIYGDKAGDNNLM